ncbi:MAG: hypothetical protein AAF417_09070 [Pseudomonadota bacterium]
MSQKTIGLLFAVSIGLLVAWYAYDRASDPQPTIERQRQEALVLEARSHLQRLLALDDEAEVVDPLAPNRVAGKVYIYPEASNWQVSGFYRRAEGTEWLPWLMRLDEAGELRELKLPVAEPRAAQLAVEDPRIVVQ